MEQTVIHSPYPSHGFGKSNLYGMIGTAASCLILFLVMWLYVMPYTPAEEPVEEEGLMISFGDSEQGGGQGDELMGTPEQASTQPQSHETTVTPPVPQNTPAPTVKTSQPSSRDYITGSEASEISAEKARKAKAKQDQIAADNARIANEKRITEQKHREQEAINKANSTMSGLFGNSSSAGNGKGTGTGSGEGPGRQGNPAGQGYAGGHSWSLSGRSLTAMAQPSYDKNVEGKITVVIRVDENGSVISTTIGSPTTIGDGEMRKAALNAASRARFSAGNGKATGSITYNFRLK